MLGCRWQTRLGSSGGPSERDRGLGPDCGHGDKIFRSNNLQGLVINLM